MIVCLAFINPRSIQIADVYFEVNKGYLHYWNATDVHGRFIIFMEAKRLFPRSMGGHYQPCLDAFGYMTSLSLQHIAANGTFMLPN